MPQTAVALVTVTAAELPIKPVALEPGAALVDQLLFVDQSPVVPPFQ